MSAVLAHRGPNDSGTWIDPSNGIAIAHRRLSILDLSKAGHQPFISASGRYVLTFNGEIYNFLELRAELKLCGVSFKSNTDTEVLIEAIEYWGAAIALKRLNGMFAFGLWDTKTSTLLLARDPFGIKPLYFGLIQGHLVFGSELSAIQAITPTELTVSRKATAKYLRYGFVPEPNTIYEGISKLTPGTAVLFSRRADVNHPGFVSDSALAMPSASLHAFTCKHWSTRDELADGARNRYSLSAAEAAYECEQVLKNAVKRQQVADVPIGAFLSGGIDSSLVVALMAALGSDPVRTFSVGTGSKQLNEAEFAAGVAKHLGTQHTELLIQDHDVLNVVPRILSAYDEPFADSSQIPMFMVSELAAKSVKVVLTGDGGDEIFCGYNRYVHGLPLWRRLQSLPPNLLLAIESSNDMAILKALDPWVDRMMGTMVPSLRHRSVRNLRNKVAKIAAAGSIPELHRALISNHLRASEFVIGAGSDVDVYSNEESQLDDLRRLMLEDTRHYLPDDILTKVDRATMFHSLEARVPLLDVEVVRFAARLPSEYLIREGKGKNVLRDVLHRYIPKELIDRPKMGFAVPIGTWLKGPLRDWAMDTFNQAESAHGDLLHWPNLRAEIDAFMKGESDNAEFVWSVAILGSWLGNT